MHFIFTSSDAKMDFRMCCADVQRGERGSQPITIRWFTKCGLVTLATIYGTALDYRLINKYSGGTIVGLGHSLLYL